MSVLVEQAGSGKGVVVSAASEAWRKERYEVIGTAIPARRPSVSAPTQNSSAP